MFKKISEFKPKRIYRIGITFVVFFIAINVVVSEIIPSYSQTLRASEILLDDNVCNFAYQDFNDLEKLLLEDKNKKIFLLGDSVSYGIGVLDESNSASGYLREIHTDYSVYNLSSCGSKPLDYYLWVKYLAGIDNNSDNIFVIQYNYKWFNNTSGKLEDKVSQKRILFEFNEYLDDEIRDELEFYPRYFEQISHVLEKSIPVSANKTKLFAAIFNEKSKEDFTSHLFFGKPEKNSFDYKQKHWSEKEELKSFNCKIAYSSAEWNSENNFNYNVYLKTLDFIKNEGVRAVVLLPPYNQELVEKCNNEKFSNNVIKFLSDAGNRNILSAEFTETVNGSYFLDDMHLDSQGNKILAEKISEEINKF